MGPQCAKLLWFHYNAKDQIPAPDAAQQAVFDQGHEVGALARQLFPGGTEIAPDSFFPEVVLAETRKLLPARRPLYEAGFAFGGGYARADTCPLRERCWSLLPKASVFTLHRGGAKGPAEQADHGRTFTSAAPAVRGAHLSLLLRKPTRAVP